MIISLFWKIHLFGQVTWHFHFPKILYALQGLFFFVESISSTFGFALFFQYQTFILKEASLADLCFEDFIKEELFFNQATVKRGYFNQLAYFDQIQIL